MNDFDDYVNNWSHTDYHDVRSVRDQLRTAATDRLAKSICSSAATRNAVTLIRDYQGRALRGWCVVEWLDQHSETYASAASWIRENVADADFVQACEAPRYFFRHESDAMLCYLAFK